MYKEELYEEGIVKEAKDGFAVIRIQDSEKCEECSAKIYCKPSSSAERNLTAYDPYGVHPGDKVRVVIKGSRILTISFLLYGVPLIIFLGGIFIGFEIFESNKELFSSLLGIGLVSIYILALFLFHPKEKRNSYPEIVFVSTARKIWI